MKPKNARLFAEFAPETRFELRPAPPAPFRATQEHDFEQLKDRLLAEKLFLAKTPELYATLRRAANEAAALAWSAFCPLLLFPGLFEEKVAELTRQQKRQRRIYDTTGEPFSA